MCPDYAPRCSPNVRPPGETFSAPADAQGDRMFSVTIREKSGQVYTFHFDKPEIMIGRVKGNDVILPKQNISKRHALIRAHQGAIPRGKGASSERRA